MSLKASISGVRGIVGDSLTPQVISDYVSAFLSILPEGAILIGRDSRVTGPMILELVKSIITFSGRDVVDMGIIPTPVVLFGVAKNNYAGGIVITASHNPQQWNALKFVNNDGKFLSPAQFKQMSESYNKKDFKYADYAHIGHCSIDKQIAQTHLDTVTAAVDTQAIRNKKLTVALDTVNGAGGEHTLKLLEKFGCNVVSINTEPTGLFAHTPEPTPANLTQLSDLIKSNKVDVGFALDPDGDRLVIADGSGMIICEELTLALCVQQYLAHHKKSDVVINLSSSRITIDIADKFGSKVYKEPTGEINVTEKMEAIGACIGGEGNGGIIAAEINKCRDASVGIAFILEMLSQTDKTLAEIVSQLPQYQLIKKKYDIAELDLSAAEKQFRQLYPQAEFDCRDGIRIDFPDKWLLVRKSNTEPIVRIFAESVNADEATALIEQAVKQLGI